MRSAERMARSGSMESSGSSSDLDSMSEDKPEWTQISFRRQASIRRSLKELPEFIKDMSNEREDMQEKTFRKWVNLQLHKAHCTPISDLFRDLRDGTKLLVLLELLTASQLPREKGKTRVHAINNVNRAIQCLNDLNVKLVNINANEIVDGNCKITLGLIWSIIQQHWKIFAQDRQLDYGELALQDVLMRWCHYSTDGYGIDVKNFTTSWKDGLGFNALLHKYNCDVFSMEDVRKMEPRARLAHAFQFAHTHLNVQNLLDPEDLCGEEIDRKSIMTYLLVLFQALPHDTLSPEEVVTSSTSSVALSPMQTPSSPLSPNSAQGIPISVKDYQLCLEQVLAWLLEAEDKLSSFEPIVNTDVEITKRQFKEHEEFMLALTQSQGNVGDALHSGQALMDSNEVNAGDKQTTQKQMTLVNDKWEALRQGAMLRQAQLQEALMNLQEAQLTDMTKWLDHMETIIDHTQPLATDPQTVIKQTQDHAEFQKKIEEEQVVVTSLSTFVAVVDESTAAEQSYEQLESTLQDIGKRWMVVCQWAEKRATRLDGLYEALTLVQKEHAHLADWLDLREAALGSLKSAHHLTSSKQVVEQVTNLQSMEKNLEEEHPRLISLSQMSSQVVAKIELENPVGANNVRRKLDEVTQRWDNLVVRMEEHSRMLVRGGKISESELNKKNTKASKVIVSTSNTTIITTTNTSFSKTTNEEAANRLRMSGPVDFQSCLDSLSDWLTEAEGRLSILGDRMTPASQISAVQKIETDMADKMKQLEDVQIMGHKLMAESGDETDGSENEQLQVKLQEVTARWSDVNLALADTKRAVDGASKAEVFQTKLAQVDQSVTELANWTQSFDPKSVTEVPNVRMALRQCQEKLELVRQKEPVVDQLQHEIEQLTELATTPEIGNAQRDFERFTARWEKVVDKLSSALEILTLALQNAPDPTVAETMTSLSDWLTAAENVMHTESLGLLDHIDVNNVKIDRLKELQAQKIVHSESMHFLETQSADKEHIDKLKKRWSALETNTGECLANLEKGVQQLNQWDKSAGELETWFDQVTEFVHSEQPAHGQLDTLNDQLEQSNGLLSDMETLRPKLQQMINDVKDMASKATPVLADYLATRMEDMETRWEDVERLANAKHASLIDAQHRSSKVFEDLEHISKFLTKLDAELGLPLDPNTGKDLQLLIRRHKQIRDELDARASQVDSAVNLAEELTASLQASPQANVALTQQLQSTRQLWDTMAAHVRSRLAHLTQAFENWKELQELLAGERVCLDQLGRKLHEPIASVADAEEFSEQLDLLERLMEGSGSRARILNIAKQLTDANLLNSAVEVELAKYDARRQELMQPAKERQKLLERGVTESQEVEQQLLNCQSWIGHVDYILSSRLDTDILASDVPEEYKQLQQEFDEHNVCLGALTEQVELYAKQGRTEAASRLTDQLNHIKTELSEVQHKFGEFKRPRDFEQRVERVSRILRDVHIGLALLAPSGASSGDCHVQLDRCQEVQSAVQELASEIDDLSRTGDKLVQSSNEETKQIIDEKLTNIKDDHVKLQQMVSEAEANISTGKSVLLKWESEQKELINFMTESEKEITKWESGNPSPNIQQDLNFIERLGGELTRRSSSWAMLEECLNQWHKVAVPAAAQALAQRLHNLRQRWNEINNTNVKWKHSLQTMQKDNAALMNDFHVSVQSMDTTVGDLEAQVNNVRQQLSVSGFSAKLVDRLKRLLNESNCLRPKMDAMRDDAVELMSRGDECESEVQPHLARLNASWASVEMGLRDLQKQLIGSSPSPAVVTPPPMRPPEISISEPVDPPNDENIVPEVAVKYNESVASSPLHEAEVALTAAIVGDSQLAKHIELSNLGLDKVHEMMIQHSLRVPEDIPQWSKQCTQVQNALDDVKPIVQQVIEQGRGLARSGSMELHVHHTLEQIDQLKTKLDSVENEVDEELCRLAPLSAQDHLVRTQIEELISWATEKVHLLSEIPVQPQDFQATQEEYGMRKPDYEDVKERNNQLQQKFSDVKPRSEPLATKATVQLDEKWNTLEHKLNQVHNEQLQAVATSQVALAVQQLEQSLAGIQDRLQRNDSALGRQLYSNFSDQQDLLAAVDENLGAVDDMISKVNEANQPPHPAEIPSPEQERLNVQLAALKTQLANLREIHHTHKREYEHRLETWQGFQTDLHDITNAIEQNDKTLTEWRLTGQDLPIEQHERLLADLERKVSEEETILHRVSKLATRMVQNLSQPDKELMNDKLDQLATRWGRMSTELSARRQRIDDMHADDTEVREEVDEMGFWCDEAETLLQTHVDPSNLNALNDIANRLKHKCTELPSQLNRLKVADKAKNKLIQLDCVPLATKHKLRQDVAELQSRFSRLRPELESRHSSVKQKQERCCKFWMDVDNMTDWVGRTKTSLDQLHNAVIYTPTQLDPAELDTQLRHRQETIDRVSHSFNQMKLEAKLDSETGDVSPQASEAMHQLMEQWSIVLNLASTITSSTSSSGSDRESSATPGDVMSTSVVQQPQFAVSNPVNQATYAQVNKQNTAVLTSKCSKSPSRERKLAKEREKVDKEVLDDEEEWMSPPPHTNLRQDEQTRQLVQLRHWLTDGQREISGAVDLISIPAIKEAAKAHQAFIDQLQTRRLGLIGILESANDQQVRHRAEVLSRGWERVVSASNARKRQLAQLLEDARRWDALRSQLELWLSEGQQRCTTGPKVSDCDGDELKRELAAIDALLSQVEEYKGKMTELNQCSNHLLDTHSQDDAAALTQTTSELNTLWSKLNDNVRIRRAVLEAALRSRKDLHTALKEFESWLANVHCVVGELDQDTDNSHMIKDAQKRKSWMDREKELRLETEAHDDVLKSLQEMGSKLATSLENTDDKQKLEHKLKQLDEKWHQMVSVSAKIRTRLESAQEQWERLTTNLKELIYWTETQEKCLYAQQPVGGDMQRVTEQKAAVAQLVQDMEDKREDLAETIQLAHAFLLQQDTRPHFHDITTDQLSSEAVMQRHTKRVAHQIKVESDTLEEKWKELRDKAQRWTKIVQDAQLKMGDFDKAVTNCNDCLNDCEALRKDWKPVKDIQLDDLPNQMTHMKTFGERVIKARDRVDDVNDRGSRLLADNIQMSPESTNILDALNNRYKLIDKSSTQRLHALQNAVKDFGPSSQHFLMGSVAPPWQRSVAANRVPYFVNHETEKTQWDHPKMCDMMLKLCDLNDVKFSAYRTGMKLRALQKKLCLDLVSLDEIHAVMEKQQLVHANEASVDVSDIVMTLLPLYEQAQANYPDLLQSLPLAIDLCLNTLLNIYDPPRLGTIRVLSVKVALVSLCRAQLQDKYKYLFNLVSSNGVSMDQKKMALLLYDSIQIPKLLGESAVFGGSNVEPSVRSCFERVNFPLEVKLDDFLDWLKQEPQSLVWLPVMHRVAAAENAKHQAKCNVCKMFPIVGLRYRCLKCFNFDVCQNCFFSQRVAKGHKVTHPMQEYCVASTSGEDVRDFSRVVRNKLKTKSHFRKHPRLGYLPVDSVMEGAPLEQQSTTPTNPHTQHMHSRLEQLAQRLGGMDKSSTDEDLGKEGQVQNEHTAIATLSSSLVTTPNREEASTPLMGRPPIPPIGTPRSPAQIVTQIDHMQKEELDQVLKQLEDENKYLQVEYERLRANMAGAATNGSGGSGYPMTNGSLGRNSAHHFFPDHHPTRSVGSLPRTLPSNAREPCEDDLLMEAKALRLHKDRLEQRSNVLEEHNSQLEIQLSRLKQLIREQNGGGSSPVVNGVESTSTLQRRDFHIKSIGGMTSAEETDSSQQDHTGRRMGSLMTTAEELGAAMGSLVNAVTSDDELSD